MKHVYLAPHLDDAGLSCGGTIQRHTGAGEPVQVVTLFAGEAQRGTTLSEFAQALQAPGGCLSQPMRLSRAEDVAALTALGAKARHLDCQDAVYRTGPDGPCVYQDREAILGEMHSVDPVVLDEASERDDRLAQFVPPGDRHAPHAPLGVGRHVDYQIAHAAARRLRVRGHRAAFYEDYPYAEQAGAVDLAIAASGAGDWLEAPVAANAADMSAKVSALGHYRSRMASLFGGTEAMPNREWAFAATRSPAVCLAERIW